MNIVGWARRLGNKGGRETKSKKRDLLEKGIIRGPAGLNERGGKLRTY